MTREQIAKTKKAAKEALTNPPEPPAHLSEKMKKFWRGVFELENPQRHEVLLLIQACEAHDRAEQARRVLKAEGLTYSDRFGKPKPRPEVAIEFNSKTLFAKLIKQLRLYNQYWAYAGD